MIWSAIQRRMQPNISPRWLEAWRVQRARQRLSARPAVAGNKQRRLFVDVSVISKHDAGTGIQRIVRAVASHLLASPPSGWEVYPVSATRKRPYHLISWPSVETSVKNECVTGQPGDVFLGLDFALDTVRFHNRELADFKQRGGQ